MANLRQNIIALVCGTRGVGKTTYLKALIEAHRKHKKVLIFDLDDNPLFADYPVINPKLISKWKAGVVRIISTDTEEVFQLMQKHLWNTLIIFEDATKYIRNKMPKTVETIALASKQRNNDCIFTFHGFNRICPDFFNWANFIEIFKTGEKIERFDYKIPNMEKVVEAKKEVDEHSSRFHHKTVRLL